MRLQKLVAYLESADEIEMAGNIPVRNERGDVVGEVVGITTAPLDGMVSMEMKVWGPLDDITIPDRVPIYATIDRWACANWSCPRRGIEVKIGEKPVQERKCTKCNLPLKRLERWSVREPGDGA